MHHFCQLLQLVTVTVTLSSMVLPQAEAKRFDCRLFCKETGFRGMLGGCRCSFTLFTAKRAIRDPIEERDSVLRALSHLLPQYQAMKKPLNPSKELYQPNMNIVPDYIGKASGKEQASSGSTPKLPGYPSTVSRGDAVDEDFERLARAAIGMLQKQTNLNKDEQGSSGSSLHDSSKRREYEMELDNGETGDVLRMPY